MSKKVAITLMLVALLPPAAAAQRAVERSVPASATGTVEIENVAGSVTVRGWDRAEVVVEGTLAPGVEELRVERRGERTVVEVVPPRDNRRDVAAELTLRVPAGSAVEVEAVSARVDVDRVTGKLELTSVNGPIEVAGAPAAVRVETVSGKIRIDATTAVLELGSVNGDLWARGGGGETRARTVSGDVELELGTVSRLEVRSVSGAGRVSCALAADARVEMSSNSGDLELGLPRSTSARIVATTFSGDVVNQLGPPARQASRYTSEKILEFTLGAGDARVELNAFSGDVELRDRKR